MQLFENETLNISEIKSVVRTNTQTEGNSKKVFRYGPIGGCTIPHYEIIYHISSESIKHFGGFDLRSTPETITFLPKRNRVDYYIECIKFGESIDIFFDTPDSMPDVPLVFKANTPELKVLFEQLHSIWIAKPNGYYTKSMSIFYKIIHLIATKQNPYSPSSKLKQLRPASEYLEKNFLQANFDYVRLAEICGLSYSYFKKLFILKYGIPPRQYVNMKKIEYAKEMLSTKQYSISTVAFTCGFESIYYFSATFKKATGVSPSFYLKNAKK